MADIIAKNIDDNKKRKAIFVLNCKGKDLSKMVRETIDKLAQEYDEKYKNI